MDFRAAIPANAIVRSAEPAPHWQAEVQILHLLARRFPQDPVHAELVCRLLQAVFLDFVLQGP
jgi:hypothetical protein